MRMWKIRCSGRDYQLGDQMWGYRHYGRFYAYLLPDQSTLDLSFIAAWCRDCREVTHAEEMPSMAAIEKELTTSVPGWRHEELTVLKKWRTQRRSPPKCLDCGSTNIVPVTLDFSEVIEQTFPHPDCEGVLHFTPSGGYTLGPVQTQRLYSFEGDYLDREIETSI
jgi:hypothetical protein